MNVPAAWTGPSGHLLHEPWVPPWFRPRLSSPAIAHAAWRVRTAVSLVNSFSVGGIHVRTVRGPVVMLPSSQQGVPLATTAP